jgi:predicted nucleotidyltransferase
MFVATEMNKERVLTILREHSAELHSAGVVHLRLFGSVARGENTAKSDVDLMVDLDERGMRSLISIGAIQVQLSEMLGTEVDLAVAKWMHEPIRSRAFAEAVLAF